MIKAGKHQSASEAIRERLRLFQQRRQHALKLKALRVRIKAGVHALKRGEFTEIANADLNDYLEGLTVPPAKGSR